MVTHVGTSAEARGRYVKAILMRQLSIFRIEQ
jgi:hypothetical protein